jgi:hypothetical protein
VLEALTTLLDIDGVEYGAIESEQLAWARRCCQPASGRNSLTLRWRFNARLEDACS